jgi:uncharacterized repeat protein (TIGR01451 family)
MTARNIIPVFLVLGAAIVLAGCGETPTTPETLRGAPSFHVIPPESPELELLVLCKVGPVGTYTFQATADRPVLWNGSTNAFDLSSEEYSIAVGATDFLTIGGQSVQGSCFIFNSRLPSGTTHDHIARASGGVPPATVTIVETGIPANIGFDHGVTYQRVGATTAAVSTTTNSVSGQVGGETAQYGANIVFYNKTLDPSLAITKTADAASVAAGTPIGFTIEVKSNGPGIANHVVLSDALPAGAGITWSMVPSVAGCSIVAGTLSCDFGDMAAGASAAVHVTSPTSTASCGLYSNTATVSADNHASVNAAATTAVECPPVCPAVGAVPALAGMTDWLFIFSNGSVDANWQGATKGFRGDVAVAAIAKKRTSGGVPFAGTIYTDGSSLGAWQNIVNQNAGQAFAALNAGAVVTPLFNSLTLAFATINAKPVNAPASFTGTPQSLNGLNTQNGINETFVLNVTSGFGVSSKINITGDAGDVFILRWDTDANFANGYQGQVKFQSGGAIVPLGGLTAANFIHVAGDIASSGGGNNPSVPFPQGPGIPNGANWNGGGFFTGYWLTTGDPVKFETSSLSNAIFVGGWYSTTVKFSMTSGTSGVHVGCP